MTLLNGLIPGDPLESHTINKWLSELLELIWSVGCCWGTGAENYKNEQGQGVVLVLHMPGNQPLGIYQRHVHTQEQG